MRILLLVVFLTWLASCSVEAKIVLGEGTASVTAKVSTQPALLAYWKDLVDLDPRLPPSPIDVKTLRLSLEQQSKLVPPRLSAPQVAPGERSTVISFGVPDTNAILGSRDLGRVTTVNGKTDLLITLDRKTLRSLFGLTTWGSSPALSSLIPSDNAKVTAADYSRLLTYLMDPYDKASKALVDNSQVVLTIELPSPPLQAEGVVSVSGNTLLCRWPLARILSLETPVTVHAVY